jgi:hypothetical protein
LRKLVELLAMADRAPGGYCSWSLSTREAMAIWGKEREREEGNSFEGLPMAYGDGACRFWSETGGRKQQPGLLHGR